MANQENDQVQVWLEGRTSPETIKSGYFQTPISLFVTADGNMYVGNEDEQVTKWSLNAGTVTTVKYFDHACYGLFVDINDILYCSMESEHKVIKGPINRSPTQWEIAAGGKDEEREAYYLERPCGIFVDIACNLYVADSGNNRIQRFEPGHLDGKTLAGDGALNTIVLWEPTGVVLDGNGYLFIVDSGYDRIVRSGPNGFRCIIGCLGKGSSPTKLDEPWSLNFDSYGNIFVVDTKNNRIQKFLLVQNSCSKYCGMLL